MAGEIPSGEGSVFHFLDIFALGCGLEACAALFAGRSIWLVVAGVLGAIAFHLLGTKWPVIKTRLWPRLVLFFEWIGNSRRFRTGALTLVVGYFAVAGILYIERLRGDLDAYVMPRAVSKEQASKLQDYLSKHEAYPVSMRVVQHDQEAMEYAGQLFNAMRQTNWDINPPNHGGPESFHLPTLQKEPKPNDLDANGKRLYTTIDQYIEAHDGWLQMDISNKIAEQNYDANGLCIQVEMPGQPINPDPKHPTPMSILQDALRYAGIEASCSGSAYNRSEYKLYLLIGHRPRVVGGREPTLSRLGRWIERLGQ
jgi:hypothetical protein